MQRWLLSSEELSRSLSRDFSYRLEHVLNSSLKRAFSMSWKALNRLWALTWYFLESPSLWEKIGPDKTIRKDRHRQLDEVRPFIHPPSF